MSLHINHNGQSNQWQSLGNPSSDQCVHFETDEQSGKMNNEPKGIINNAKGDHKSEVRRKLHWKNGIIVSDKEIML